MEHKQLSKHFNSREFDSPDSPFSGLIISKDIIQLLEVIRLAINKPLQVNSGVRSKEHNLKIGGVSDSSHLTGLAVDISIKDSVTRYKALNVLIKNGVKRIGLHANFIHFDLDRSKPQEVFWVYSPRV